MGKREKREERREREREREREERERERYRPRSPVSRPTARPATLFVSFSAWSAWRQHQHPRLILIVVVVFFSSRLLRFFEARRRLPRQHECLAPRAASPKLNLVCCSLKRRQSASFVSLT